MRHLISITATSALALVACSAAARPVGFDGAVPTTIAKAMAALGSDTTKHIAPGSSIADLYDQFSAIAPMTDAQKTTYSQSNSPTAGLTMYDLSGPAKLLYPVPTPLRNMIARVDGKGTQANWKAILGVNTGNISAGVSEGNRNAVIATQTADYYAAYKGLGHEANSTWESEYAAAGFDDIRMRDSQAALTALMLSEEKMILNGNGSLNLGITPTPAASASTTGGALAAATYSVICVALTAAGYYRATIAGGLVQQVSRTNADASTDTINCGTAQKSATGSATTTGTTGSITATVAAVRGAQAYAWFWGAAGAEVLGQITTVPKVVITGAAAGTQTAASLTAADYSVDGLSFDGLITQAFKAGSGAYWADLGGATLTSNGTGGANEIDALLQNRWDIYRLNPTTIWVSSAQAQKLSQVIVTGMATTAMRLVVQTDQGGIQGNSLVTAYQNNFGSDGATTLQIRQHPNMIPGTILITQNTVPYPMNDTPNVIQMKVRRDYHQIEWPIRSRKTEMGVYTDEVLQVIFPAVLGLITGVG